MKTLQFDQNGNMGGLQCMFAIPVTSFKQIWRDYTNSLNFLRVMNREDIIEIYINDNATFTEAYDRNAYKPEISGVVPKSHPLNRKELTRLETEYWLVLFRDNNDYWRLAGNAQNRLSFKRTDTAGQLTSTNQLQFTFTGNMRTACEFIELAEIEDL